MKRFLTFLLVGVCCIVLARCSSDHRPNLLLITIDTLRSDRIGCYGCESVHTPNIDRLAAQGVAFAECSSPIPETSPAHVTILSGLYPASHGLAQNGVPLSTEVPMLAEALAGAGYSTAAYVSGFPLVDEFGLSRGFDHYDDFLTDGFTNKGGERRGTERNGERTVDAALRGARHLEEPYFLWVHLFDPHSVYAAPGPYRRIYYDGVERDPSNRTLDGIQLPGYLMLGGVTDVEYPIALYEGEVRWTDHQVGRLIDGFDHAGLLDNTVISLVADHGESLREHGYYFGHSRFLYEPSVHVPWIIRGTDHFPAGKVVSGEVSLVDVPATLIDLLGVSALPVMDGRSAIPLVHGAGMPVREIWLDRSPLIEGELSGVRRGKWKYLQSDERGEELYDLEADPGEQTNMAGKNREKAVELRRLLEARRNSVKTLPAEIDPETREILRGLGYVD